MGEDEDVGADEDEEDDADDEEDDEDEDEDEFEDGEEDELLLVCASSFFWESLIAGACSVALSSKQSVGKGSSIHIMHLVIMVTFAGMVACVLSWMIGLMKWFEPYTSWGRSSLAWPYPTMLSPCWANRRSFHLPYVHIIGWL